MGDSQFFYLIHIHIYQVDTDTNAMQQKEHGCSTCPILGTSHKNDPQNSGSLIKKHNSPGSETCGSKGVHLKSKAAAMDGA